MKYRIEKMSDNPELEKSLSKINIHLVETLEDELIKINFNEMNDNDKSMFVINILANIQLNFFMRHIHQKHWNVIVDYAKTICELTQLGVYEHDIIKSSSKGKIDE